MRIMTFRDALNEAIHEEMARDDRIFLIGEDVATHGGNLAVTKGIAEAFPNRIRETPIAEAAIVGVAVGAALAGMRPVAEIMYIDFVTCAMDEVVNQAAKMRYMTGGQASVPMVLRLPCGLSRYTAAQHSQALESWFMHVPGLHVVVPSTPQDAKGLFRTAVREPDPVLFLEYKRLYSLEGEVSDIVEPIPLGLAEVKRAGEDVTVVAVGPMVSKALEAGILLEDEGIDIEVVDPRCLSPLDVDTLAASARRTGRAVVCAEDALMAGCTAEIACAISERCFSDLSAPVRRLAALDVPMPFSAPLADKVVPSVEQIVEAVKEVVNGH
jgi:pyruvate/2-oxoglutarate/acetoin dehydrogenase E1 component